MSHLAILNLIPTASSLQPEERLEVVKGELVGLLGAGQHAVRQLQLLLLQLQDARLHRVLAQEPEKRKKKGRQKLGSDKVK